MNGGRIKPTYRLALNDRVRVPPVRSREQAPVQMTGDTVDILEQCILFEDDDLIVINKPPGVCGTWRQFDYFRRDRNV